MQSLISNLIKEADIDFISLPLVLGCVEDRKKGGIGPVVRDSTLNIVQELMSRGIYPGDYDYGESSFHFWRGSADEHLKRIMSEWANPQKKPDLGEPICWFALRPPNLAEGSFWIMGKWVEP